MAFRDFLGSQIRDLTCSPWLLRRRFPDLDDETRAIIGRVLPYTMTSPERISAVVEAVRYVEARDVPGDFVECGVWKGGSSMAAALAFRSPRPFHLFDTFEGMAPPDEVDQRYDGAAAKTLFADKAKSDSAWCYSPLDEVKANMGATGYAGPVHYIKGKVEDTIPDHAPERIALLRLDTDWYESTRHELAHLYPRISPGGVLIIDDYGYWKGARRAVDEYFGGTILLGRLDGTGRIAVKTA